MKSEPSMLALQPAGFFVVRTPLLPFETTLALGAPDGVSLQYLLDDPMVRRALIVSARSPQSVITRWLTGQVRGPREEAAILRYLLRMATRPTPFGLSAGWSTGLVGTYLSITLGPRAEYQEVFQPSVQCQTFDVNDRTQSETQRLMPNPSARAVGPFLTYTIDRLGGEARRDIVASPAVGAALSVAGDGADRNTLVQKLKKLAYADLPDSAITRFIDRLVNEGVLVPAEGVRVTVKPEDDRHSAVELEPPAHESDVNRDGPNRFARAQAHESGARTYTETGVHAELLKPANAVLAASVVNDLGIATEQL